MYLSINDAVAMALENNLDIVLQRYNLSIADTDLLRTKSGLLGLGVNQGVNQGTPGGKVGLSRRNRQLFYRSQRHRRGWHPNRSGRAGAGAGGLVGSTLGGGPPLPSYDPVLTATSKASAQRRPRPTFSSRREPTVVQNTNIYNFGYTQAFSTGTQASSHLTTVA